MLLAKLMGAELAPLPSAEETGKVEFSESEASLLEREREMAMKRKQEELRGRHPHINRR